MIYAYLIGMSLAYGIPYLTLGATVEMFSLGNLLMFCFHYAVEVINDENN